MTVEQSSHKTAGIIIIGNEILSGKVHDSNAHYLASELRTLGVLVLRISVIPDEIDIIGKEVTEFSRAYNYVFTSGGIGPTHDDVTIEGIAAGFKVKRIQHPELERIFLSRYRDSVNEAVLKMCVVPDGAELIMKEGMRFPLVVFKNIYIFPGIPEYLRNKFSLIKERFRCSSFHIRRFFLNAHESDVAAILNRVVSLHRNVIFGSYPVIGNPEYRVIITVESKSDDSVKEAVDELQKRIPDTVIVRIE